MKPGNLRAWSRARLAGRTRLGDGGPVLSVPIVAQTTDFSCGAAALLACLKYWLGPSNLPADEASLWGLLGTNPIEGTGPEPIAGVARALGLYADVFDGLGVADVPSILASGATALLAVQAWDVSPETYDKTDKDGHWVVLVGADEEQARFMDPSSPEGYAHMDLADLARRWHDLDAPGGLRPGLAVLVSSSHAPASSASSASTSSP